MLPADARDEDEQAARQARLAAAKARRDQLMDRVKQVRGRHRHRQGQGPRVT